MELLKLVIVDDEPILLQGLLDTYDWESMGFEVVGSAKSGVQALEVIRREQPHVVLTDIRMSNDRTYGYGRNSKRTDLMSFCST